jgi:hypothetical protein
MITINWLTLFKEIIAVYSENHKKPINALCGQNAVIQYIQVRKGLVTAVHTGTQRIS